MPLSARQPPESKVKMYRVGDDTSPFSLLKAPPNSDIFMKDSVEGVGCCCGSSCLSSSKKEITPKNKAGAGKVVWKKDFKTKSRMVWRGGDEDKEEEK